MSSDGIVKVLNALPISKLISTVSAGIGKMYEPRHKRKMADATAYEINAIGEAMRNVADIPIVYNQDGVAINSEDFNRLMQRAGTRLVLQETIKQHNIESVVDNAYEILEKEERCSAEPVEQGWINRFFDSVADVSDEDLQKLWGKVLADEIKQPHTYSLRTLETLKNLSQAEAQNFTSIIPFVLIASGNENKTAIDYFILDGIYAKYGFDYSFLESLSDAGLISTNMGITTYIKIYAMDEETIKCVKGKLRVRNNNNYDVFLNAPAFMLTQAGKELYKMLFESEISELDEAFLEDCKKCFDGSLHMGDFNFLKNENVEIIYGQ